MKKPLIVLNWKARKTTQQAEEWLDALSSRPEIFSANYFYVLAVPFTLLPFVSAYVSEKGLPFVVSAQDVSAFPEGSFTGEIPASLVTEFALYTLIGHSERREHVKETPEICEKKMQLALDAGLTPIFCVQSETTPIPLGVEIVAYEPPTAIGSGEAEGITETEEVVRKIKEKHPTVQVLYGGSVDQKNISSFLSSPELAGVLVGTQSIESTSTISLFELID